MSFTHLNIHSEFSIEDSIIHIPQLLKLLVDMGYSSVALTDMSNIVGALRFYQECIRSGVKPIIGVDAKIQCPIDSLRTGKVTLLCQNNDGFSNLKELISDAHLNSQEVGSVVINWSQLQSRHLGLLMLLDDQSGPLVDSSYVEKDLLDRYSALHNLFGDRLYCLVSRVGNENGKYISALVKLAEHFDLSLVAHNRVVFLRKEDYEAHEVRVCINERSMLNDTNRVKRYTENQYLKTEQEMTELFSDMPEAIQNASEIAKRCNVTFALGDVHMPEYSLGGVSSKEALNAAVQKGMSNRGFSAESAPSNYQERLNYELSVIDSMGFNEYFLIVDDFVRWSKTNGVRVGPGRGSGAGSLVAWALGITEINPIPYNLVFERFLNPDRKSMPDFDIDFCSLGRERVINYVSQKYGKDKVAQIIVVGTMAAKAAIRDTGRVKGLPYNFVAGVAKLIPIGSSNINSALEDSTELRNLCKADETVEDLINMSMQIEGVVRNFGVHPGGVVISPTKITDFTALYLDPKDHSTKLNITQFDKDDIEQVGLIKFDLLGVKTLTTMGMALDLINIERKKEGAATIEPDDIPLDDKSVYKFIRTGRTEGIFQLESRGMRQLLVDAKVNCFEDVAAVVGVYRPGPIAANLVTEFVDNRKSVKNIKWLHKDIIPILKPTSGIIIFQEQVMAIAKVLAGYTAGEADIFRRSMSKKNPDEMKSQRKKFIDGALRYGVSLGIATDIFDIMEKFSGYAFNRSHTVAYTYISCQLAWMKKYYPAQYMAAVLTTEIDAMDSAKVEALIADCRHHGVSVEIPCVNASQYNFSVGGERTILYGLGAIKGVGKASIDSIIAERDKKPYANFLDFLHRIDHKDVKQAAVKVLIQSGAFHRIQQPQEDLLFRLDEYIAEAKHAHDVKKTGQKSFFSLGELVSKKQEFGVISEAERLKREQKALGFYLSGHPFEEFNFEFETLNREFLTTDATEWIGFVCGVVDYAEFRTGKKNVKKGESFKKRESLNIRLSVNLASKVEAYLTYSKTKTREMYYAEVGDIVVLSGRFSKKSSSNKADLRVEHLFKLGQWRREYLIGFGIHVISSDIHDDMFFERLRSTLEHENGENTLVKLSYTNGDGYCGNLFSKKIKVMLSDQSVFASVAAKFPSIKWSFNYDEHSYLRLLEKVATHFRW